MPCCDSNVGEVIDFWHRQVLCALQCQCSAAKRAYAISRHSQLIEAHFARGEQKSRLAVSNPVASIKWVRMC